MCSNCCLIRCQSSPHISAKEARTVLEIWACIMQHPALLQPATMAASQTCSTSGRGLSATRCSGRQIAVPSHRYQTSSAQQRIVVARAEKKEYYDWKDMPPLPLTVSKIWIPKLGYTIVDKSCEERRMASLAIFYDIYKDDQYRSTLTRKSAITALCMYDRDDVDEAARTPGAFPNIDLLQRVYNEGMEVEFAVEEVSASSS